MIEGLTTGQAIFKFLTFYLMCVAWFMAGAYAIKLLGAWLRGKDDDDESDD